MLDRVEMDEEKVVVQQTEKETNDNLLSDAEELAENIVEALVKEASTPSKESDSTTGFTCEMCEGKFTLQEKLKEHIKRVHANEKQ